MARPPFGDDFTGDEDCKSEFVVTFALNVMHLRFPVIN